MGTANPHFELQQQAMSNLRRIHLICLLLQLLQLILCLMVAVLAHLSTVVGAGLFLFLPHTAIAAFLSAIFAHSVTFSILFMIGRNLQLAHQNNPRSVEQWLVIASRRLKFKILPFMGLHLLSLAILAFFISQARWPSFAAALFSVATIARVYFALDTNTRYIDSFVSSAGVRASLKQSDI
ncbi:MAG: hypothetical protein AB1540_04915 [Bdellovibrionota bacterium]